VQGKYILGFTLEENLAIIRWISYRSHLGSRSGMGIK
jgi:hypothetical protein